MNKGAVLGESVLILFGWPLLAVLALAGFVHSLPTVGALRAIRENPCGPSLAVWRSLLFDPVVGGFVAALAVLSVTLLLTCREALGDAEESVQLTLILCTCYSVASFVVGGI